MPSLPLILGVTVKDLNSNLLDGATVTLTKDSEVLTKTSNSLGEAVFNLGDFDSWAPEDSATFSASKTGEGRISEVISLPSSPTLYTLTMAETSDYNIDMDNTFNLKLHAAMIFGYDGRKITTSNRFPVNAVLTGEGPDNIFRNINATLDGDLNISDNSSGLAISKGDVTGTTFIHKFGAAPDFDVADGFVTVWDGAEDDVVWEKMDYTYSTTDDIDSLSSENNGDTQDIEIQGLDANYDLVVQTITLTGQTPVSLTRKLLRVFRLKNISATDNAGHIFCYVSGGTVTLGVPQVVADIRAIINLGNNQTLMAVYTIPNGKTGYMRSWYASTAGAKRDSQHSIELRARPLSGVFQLKHLSNITVTGTSHIQHTYTEPEILATKTDIEIRMDTDTDIAGVSAGFDIILVDD